MPTFDTPRPIDVVVELIAGDVTLTASDRADAVVDVRPADPADASDVRAAEQVRVDFAHGTLVVKAQRQWRQYAPFANHGTVEVTVEVPTGSSIQGTVGMGAFRGDGELGACRLETGMGRIRLDETGELFLKTGYGDLTVDRAVGDAEVVTGTGTVRLAVVEGAAAVKNANGETRLGVVAGDVRVRSSNGTVTVDRAGGSVDAKTATGDIRIGEAVRGTVVVKTTVGELDVGIAAGTAAWLDLDSSYGRVQNRLEAADGPGECTATVEVHARTSHGDIVIHRAGQAAPRAR